MFSGGDAASPGAPDPRGPAPAGRAGGEAAQQGLGPRRTPWWRNPSTSHRRARSSGRSDDQPRGRGGSRAERVTNHSSRRGRSARGGEGGTTNHYRPGTRRTPARSVGPRDRSADGRPLSIARPLLGGAERYGKGAG